MDLGMGVTYLDPNGLLLAHPRELVRIQVGHAHATNPCNLECAARVEKVL